MVTIQSNRRDQQGFTLVELMVVVAILALLTAIAIPSYNDYMLRTDRATGKAKLMDVANKQEQFFLNNKSYTTDLTKLGYGGGFMDRQGQMTAASSVDTIYAVTAAAGASGDIATTYTLTATPQGRQVNDTKCGTLTIDNAGTKTESGTQEQKDCWGM